MNLTIPELSLVVLVGASGSGKSSFARKHFLPTEVLSSDFCRGLVSDDENDQAATKDAFEVLHFVASKRLAAGRLTVVDATNVQPEARKPLVALARAYHCLPVAVVLDVPERVCQDRNASRPDRYFGPHVVRNHVKSLRQSLRGLEREGFRHHFVLHGPEEIDAATVTREPLYNNKKNEHGPFDIIGDVHGCFDELTALLAFLGYSVDGHAATPPAGRKAVFLGDLADRGPKTPDVLKLVMGMVSSGTALCVPGNHDVKLLRKLRGKDVQITHGLAETLAQMGEEPPEFSGEVKTFLDALVSHYVLDGGRLVVAHAGMKAEMQGRGSGQVREFALYGETTGETDESGCRSATPGPASTGARRMSCTATHPSPRPNGSTTRSTSTPAASSAGGSRPCAGRSARSFRFPRLPRMPSRPARSCPQTNRPPRSQPSSSTTTCWTSTTFWASGSSGRAWAATSRSARRTASPPWK